MHTLSDPHRMFAESFPERALWSHAWLLSKRLGEGHVCIGLDEPAAMGAELPYMPVPAAEIRNLRGLVGSPGEVRPFIIDGDRLYLHRYHGYETRIVERLREKVVSGRVRQEERRHLLEGVSDLVRSLTAEYALDGLRPDECVDWQLVAALNAMLLDFSIITGGPGTGKTTTLAKMLRILYACQPGARVALAAPTGKAAMRMLESLKRSAATFPEEVRRLIEGLKPATLHRLLGWQRGSLGFKYNADRPLEYDLVVVDEASMVDMPMFARLLDALGDRTRLVLLGDKDQLASVEAGSLLGDLCQSVGEERLNGFDPGFCDWCNGFLSAGRGLRGEDRGPGKGILAGCVTELRLSHRFRAQGDIGRLSRAIISGDVETVQAMAAAESLEVGFDKACTEDVLEDFIQGYAGFIREPDPLKALAALNRLRVLVAVRDGARGLYAVNRRIEQMLQSHGLLKPTDEFYANRPVIVTRNNYELDLFNGDVGICRPVGRNVRIHFEAQDGSLRDVPAASLSHCETVFAMTIHKSQGSEFDDVLVHLPEGADTPILTRELLYTGVTRARKRVMLQAGLDTLLHTTAQRVRRTSGLQDRLGR
jgi:exodeoxyribonuclease V alpha subunit